VWQAHARQQRLVPLEKIGIETEVTLDAFFIGLNRGDAACSLRAHAFRNSLEDSLKSQRVR
jgi:hypothetical protein